MLTVDFGDAPEFYPTLLSENGARHEEVGPTLGAARDGELDGTHSANADADGADDDGVTFGAIQVGQLGATVTVNVQGGDTRLDAWIDFNGDGYWGGPDELIIDNEFVLVGDNVLSFDVPSWAVDGVTFARFRVSTDGDLPPSGYASDGEVEDYAVTIAPPAPASGVFSDENAISSFNPNTPFGVFVADLDGDGDLDALSASFDDDTVAWYENDGAQNYTPHTITTAADAAVGVFAADVDGDADLDVLVASHDDDTIAWWENDGSQNFAAHIITNTADAAASVMAADVDRDGDLDVLSASSIDDTIAWYENDGIENFTPHSIFNAADAAVSVDAGDVDGDGDLDVLSASIADGTIAWYENDGAQNFIPHVISSTAAGAYSVFAADIDGDGDLDVLSAAYDDDTIAWYENDGVANFTAHAIATDADGAVDVMAADVDGDGDTDVVSASFLDNRIAWYENDGSQNFTTHTISTTVAGALAVTVGDADGDNDIDIFSATFFEDRIGWFENLGWDFGDAPQYYPTLLSENGARHAPTGPTLGATRDAEADGTHSASADADGADEDGVTFATIQVGQLGATMTVNVQGDAANLDAWIDFNGDGSWGGPGEQIADAVAMGVDDNFLSFDVPSWAVDGVTFGRFRLSTAGDLGVTSLANDGEVEDYAVTIDPPAAASGVFGGQSVISAAADHASSVFAADVDGDGDMDVLSASFNDDKIAWYENDGSQNFTPHTISTAADAARRVFAADMDGDGDLDVLSASSTDDKIAWYENDGSQNFTPHTISTAADGAFSVFAADLDGDGDMDVLSASGYDDKIAWYENDGSQNFTPHTISTAADFAVSVFAADVDGDGDLDVLSASFNDDKIAWYENDGNQNFTPHTITTAANGAWSVFAADVDGDDDLDVLSASSTDDKIAWYENDGSQNFTPHTITTAANLAISVFAADVDGDGDLDVLSASRLDDKIAWYENDGSQNFTPHTISTAADGAASVIAADVDGDGDLDILSASFDDNRIAWYENDPVYSTIAGRHLFYNQSGTSTRYDGNNLAINASDDLAIATDKTAYLWEDTGAATFANVSSYTKGINGIMVDISGSHPSITADDFIFRVGNNNSPGLWATANAPTSISVRAGAGVSGSDRVEIIWNTGAPIKQWLEVIVLANADTGLAQKVGHPAGHGDAFFFGNAVGNTGTGDTAANSLVTALDESAIRGNNALISANIPITNIYDVGRNASVSALDESAARLNGTNPTTTLKYLNLTTAPAAPEADGVDALVAGDFFDGGVASALAASALTSLQGGVPRWILYRLDNIDLSSIDLNTGTPARLLQYLHDANTPRSRALLQKFDHVADAPGLDDELLDALLADLK